jgi:gliding motility-associated-like protein
MKIQEPEELKAIIETTDATCAGARDGKLRIFPKGGTSPYKYSIDSKIFNGVPTIVGLKSGYYNVTVKDLRGCLTSDNDVYIEEPEAIKIDLGDDITIKYGDTTKLFLESYFTRNQSFKYLWKTDYSNFISCTACQSPMVFPTNTASYSLVVTNNDGCTATDEIIVKVNYAPVIEVPTGFTPNGDGVNDLLLIHGDSNIKIKYFNIYSREGSLVYSMEDFYINDTKMGWDGTQRGQKLPAETFIWGMEVEYPNGQTETLKGNTTLLR